MPNEWDRLLIPSLFQTGFTVCLGATYRGFELMINPKDAFDKLSGQVKEMTTVPDDAGEGIEAKAKAVAGVWMEKGISAFEDFKATGNKFTGDE
ncbi:MAG: hypothetical protein R2729_10990 [Bryobacteraceae bacterium]